MSACAAGRVMPASMPTAGVGTRSATTAARSATWKPRPTSAGKCASAGRWRATSAGENPAPPRSGRPNGWSWHLFATSDAAWVIRDITLDGNTFRNSHSVDKRHVVAYGGYGVAVMYGRWKFAAARYHSTREFNGQRQSP